MKEGGAWSSAPDPFQLRLPRLTDSPLYFSTSPMSASSAELHKVDVKFGGPTSEEAYRGLNPCLLDTNMHPNSLYVSLVKGVGCVAKQWTK